MIVQSIENAQGTNASTLAKKWYVVTKLNVKQSSIKVYATAREDFKEILWLLVLKLDAVPMLIVVTLKSAISSTLARLRKNVCHFASVHLVLRGQPVRLKTTGKFVPAISLSREMVLHPALNVRLKVFYGDWWYRLGFCFACLIL